MVNAIVSDSFTWNQSKLVTEIIKEYHELGSVVIDLLNEGPDLNFCGLYNLLDYVTDTFGIPKHLISIITNNIEEVHDHYKIIINGSQWIIQAQNQINNYSNAIKNNNLKHIGLFVARLSWPRLGFLSWMDRLHADKALLTCHYDALNEIHRINAPLADVNQNIPDDLVYAAEFLKKCPIRVDNEILSIPPDPAVLYSLNQTVYKNIFIELVCETFFTGTVFCPNEKTLRPIIAKTPFIIMGPQSYLETLKRCGFKTFGKYWDESYDNFSGVDRFNKVKKVLDYIFSLSQDDIQTMYNDMKPLLEHNKQCLIEMNEYSFKKFPDEH